MVFGKKKGSFPLPLSFVESISGSRLKKRYFSGDKDSFGDASRKLDSKRIGIFYFLILAAIAVLLLRLFFLTIVKGGENRALSDENRIRLVEVPAGRGQIFDRNGKLLAFSRETFQLKKGAGSRQISAMQAQELKEKGLAQEDFEGELGQVSRNTARDYLLGEAAAHVMGYVTAEGHGQSGIEATYEQFLQGKAGKKLIEVDALNKKVALLANDEPQAGRDIYLTIDRDLQKTSFEALKKQTARAGVKKAAVIVSDPTTGEILALVSMPAFDPAAIAKYLNGLDQPFINRVIGGTYPPGSIFKIVSALAGLESGAIGPATEIEDVGEFFIGETRFVNWYFLTAGGRDGVLKIDRAIARSNDIFFYRLAERVGLDGLRQMAIKLGFGQGTGVDLPDEALGLVPDDAWKKAAYNEGWYLGDTLHLSIGQGFALATPIQLNVLTSYMASGKIVKPYLTAKIAAKGVQEEIRFGPKVLSEEQVKKENFNLVREGMKQACEKGGTGWPFFNAPYKVGCKTGTAEKALGNPHALFTVFAPYENPQVSITVVIEDGGEGSSVAAPVAREILDWYFLQRNR